MSASPESEVQTAGVHEATAHPVSAGPARVQVREYSDFDPRSAPGTYFLLAVNFAVFLWMFPHSPPLEAWQQHDFWTFFITSYTPQDLLAHGATGNVAVLSGEWYRLITAAFVHVNPLHLLTNMWCLWNLGLLGEPLLGPLGLVLTYLLTGVAGFLLSLAGSVAFALYSRLPLVPSASAGASGAIFGLAGILIVLLSNRKLPIPWEELKQHRLAVILFSVVNLVVGGVSIFFTLLRIDNGAHLGGFFCGIALGFPLLPRMTAGRQRYLRRQYLVFGVAALCLSLFGYWIANLQ